MQESTLGVELKTQKVRRQSNGAILYDYEYELDSTRGRKRILNTVTIIASKLFIVNAQYKCGKEAFSDADEAAVKVLREIVASFVVST